MKHSTKLSAAGIAVALAAGVLASTPLRSEASPATSPAASSAPPPAQVLVESLVSPLSIAVADGGTVWFTQNFAGLLMKRQRTGELSIEAEAEEGAELGAVSVHDGRVRYAVTDGDQAHLYELDRRGRQRELADIARFERRHNPDGEIEYGLDHPGCETRRQARYEGVVESHPYATEQTAGPTYLADAAGNTILRYGRRGRLSLVAVIPPTRVVLDEEMVEALDLPRCAEGQPYRFEAVPTDVELGPDGMLYVTTLPGGPEDGSTGAIGRIYRVDPRTGATRVVVRGLVSPVGLAVTPGRRFFVSELFSGRVVRVPRGAATPNGVIYTSPFPGDIDLRRGGDLYLTDFALGGGGSRFDVGRVVRIDR